MDCAGLIKVYGNRLFTPEGRGTHVGLRPKKKKDGFPLRAIPFEIPRGDGLEKIADAPPPHILFFHGCSPYSNSIYVLSIKLDYGYLSEIGPDYKLARSQDAAITVVTIVQHHKKGS